MKKAYTLLVCFAFSNCIFSFENFPENKYAKEFQKAYSLNPGIPKGVLEAIAFTQTHFDHITNYPASCIGYPTVNGLMGLVENGKGYFRNNLLTVSELSGYQIEAIKNDPQFHVNAYAKAFTALQQKYHIRGNNLKDYLPIFIELSELPLNSELQDNFALNTHLYQLLFFLQNKEASRTYYFPNYSLSLEEIFGDNYNVLSSGSVIINGDDISTGSHQYKFASLASTNSVDYAPALWDAAASCNYSSRNSTAITAVTIHDVEGTYAGCISWFKNCAANASAHYVVRSSDGQVTQMVLESVKAWHVGSENPYTVGIEHEGYNNNASWYTNAMYVSSANLTRDICTSNAINPLRTYYGPGCSGSTAQCLLGACTKVKGHQMYPNQTHNDPGPYWNWAKYYKLINDTYTVTTYTASTGALYDTGGPSNNYSSDERKFWLITKPSITNITLNFSSFNVESGYDNLFIYDGGSVNSPLIGQYTGSVNPGAVTSTNDSLLIEFRSDCATTAAGWAATYTTVTSVQTNTDIISPNTSIAQLDPWISAAFTSTITDADNLGGSGVEKGYYQAIDFNGTEWRANYTKGFFADNFDNAIHPEWTVKTGTWNVTGNALVQSDETSTVSANTNIYAALTQSLSNRYLYQFVAKFEGSGNTRRAGLHFFVDKPDSSNRNNSYFVWFRLDDQKIQIYKVVNNVFGAPKVDLPLTFNAGQWYDIKVIYDRITGKMSVYMNNSMIATWTDTAPYTNGDYISFRSANCKFSVDEIKVYRSRNNSAVINVGSGMANELRYQNPSPIQPAGKIKSICQDVAGNLSPIQYYDLNIDWTAPSAVAYINDGNAADVAIVNTTDSLRANWAPSSDPNSGIVRYWYSIGTAPGSTNTLGWTSNWAATSVTAKNLVLTQQTVYYFNVMSENGAGMYSSVTSSDGQKVDNTYVPTNLTQNIKETNLEVYPNPFDHSLNINIYLNTDSDVTITISDIQGKQLYTLHTKESSGLFEKKLNFENFNFSNGTYLLMVRVNENEFTRKVIKE